MKCYLQIVEPTEFFSLLLLLFFSGVARVCNGRGGAMKDKIKSEKASAPPETKPDVGEEMKKEPGLTSSICDSDPSGKVRFKFLLSHIILSVYLQIIFVSCQIFLQVCR